MHTDDAERVIEEFCAAVGVRPPRLRVKRRLRGCMYNALMHRIVVGEALLSGKSDVVRVMLAHEVGHATQRRATLLSVLPASCAVVSFAIGWLALLAAEDPNVVLQLATLIAGLCVMGLSVQRYFQWQEPLRIARELEADAISAMLCGRATALATLRAESRDSEMSPEIRARLAQLETM